MNGTEKQNKWAEEISVQAQAEMKSLADALNEAGETAAAAAAERVIHALSRQTNAAWFIQNRDRLSVKASHPAQCATPGTGWNGFSFFMIRAHKAFVSSQFFGLGMKEEGAMIYMAVHDLEENARLASA